MLLRKAIGIVTLAVAISCRLLLIRIKQYSSESRETHIDLSSCVMHGFLDLLLCLGYVLKCTCVFNNSIFCREGALKTTVCSHSFRPDYYPSWWLYPGVLCYTTYTPLVQKSKTILKAWDFEIMERNVLMKSIRYCIISWTLNKNKHNCAHVNSFILLM